MKPSSPPLGLYLHVPFCQARCSYCAFYTVPWRTESGFTKALEAEIYHVAREGRQKAGWILGPQAGKRVDTIYFGGGTPSLLAGADLARLVEKIEREFDLAADAEITLEVNPETVVGSAARDWLAAGITRVSLGVQSFDAAVLKVLGRLHDRLTIMDSVRRLRGAGLENLSLDLIAGINVEGFDADLEAACGLDPDHLSVYLLETDELEVGGVTALARQMSSGRFRKPENDWFAGAYGRIVKHLAAEGLMRYEISNFARPGRQSRHNLKYWRSQEVLGFGPGAHSLSGDCRYAVAPDLAAYLEAAGRGCAPPLLVDPTGPVERASEALFLALRLEEGIDLAAWSRRSGACLDAGLRAEIKALRRAHFMRGRQRLKLTEKGILVSSEIFQRFIPRRSRRVDMKNRRMISCSS